ncbi:MAG: MFS transporter [Aquificaceae bacterium]
MTNRKGHAYRLIILFGIVSLLADMTYEGARGILGPYMSLLGSSAFVVGFVVGFGEFIGYAARLLSGYIADRTKEYWPIVILGYLINLFSVPLLSLAPGWQIACLLILLERFGKSVRTPSRDVLLSFVTSRVGHGLGFGVHELLDQMGALLGPLFVSVLMLSFGSYRISLASLSIPALFALITLIYTKFNYTYPVEKEERYHADSLRMPFWVYLLACCLIAIGYADFALVSFHVKKNTIFADEWIPLLYAFAMGIDALSALLFGFLFDRIGLSTLLLGTFISSLFSIFCFSYNGLFVLFGLLLWGFGMGVQESIMRAAIAKLAPVEARGKAFGIFHFFYGLFWFLGSSFMGYLYEVSLIYLIIFSVSSQLLSLVPLFILSNISLTKFRSSG